MSRTFSRSRACPMSWTRTSRVTGAKHARPGAERGNAPSSLSGWSRADGLTARSPATYQEEA